VGEVSLALVDKCLAGRSTTKEKAIQALLLFVQIGAVEPVLVRLAHTHSLSLSLSSCRVRGCVLCECR
jgi:hypothetical protein